MKRNSKITADITEEAKELLQKYACEHERSYGWLLNRMILKYCEPEQEVKKVTKGKVSYPSNLEEEFERLWTAKGKKGAKQNAKKKYKSMLVNADNSICTQLANMLIADIESRQDELGMPEMHLTTYLNQSRWEQ